LLTLGNVLKICRRSTNFWATFFHGTSMYKIRQVIAWATVWATFSQTHLVTLFVTTDFGYSLRPFRLLKSASERLNVTSGKQCDQMRLLKIAQHVAQTVLCQSYCVTCTVVKK
jgi:hypothetical protein